MASSIVYDKYWGYEYLLRLREERALIANMIASLELIKSMTDTARVPIAADAMLKLKHEKYQMSRIIAILEDYQDSFDSIERKLQNSVESLNIPNLFK